MDEGVRLRPVWVLVRVFTMKLWFFHEFVKLFEPYSQVLALDQATAEHLDFRMARVRVGLCDKSSLLERNLDHILRPKRVLKPL
jgi:hypothetical protein